MCTFPGGYAVPPPPKKAILLCDTGKKEGGEAKEGTGAGMGDGKEEKT